MTKPKAMKWNSRPLCQILGTAPAQIAKTRSPASYAKGELFPRWRS